MTTVDTTGPKARTRDLARLSPFALPLVLFAVVAIAGVTTPGFLAGANLLSILINASIIGIAAVGMTPVTLSGNFISLAVAQTAVLAGVTFISLAAAGTPVALAALAAVAVLMVLGAAVGVVVAIGLNPVVATLGAGVVVFGLVNVVVGGRVVSSDAVRASALSNFQILGVGLPVLGFLVITVVLQIIITRTVLGRQWILAGSNRATAQATGIPVARATVLAFVALSVGTALAAVLSTARFGQASSTDFSTLTFDVVAAVLVGGTAIQGGEGSAVRSALGAIVIAALSNVMLLLDFSFGFRLLVTGLLVAVVVAALHILKGGLR